MFLNFDQLKKQLTIDQIIKILGRLGASQHEDRGDYLLFPTVCHNLDESRAGMNLAYYKESKLFRCFSECGETFDIYGLVKRRLELEGDSEFHSSNLFFFVLNHSESDLTSLEIETNTYFSNVDKYKIQDIDVVLPQYKNTVLEAFRQYYPIAWLEDGIRKETMDYYNIRYCSIRNAMIIPHYDIENRLVGIRQRPFDEEKIKRGKYKPVVVGGKIYKHQTGLNLYGIHRNKENIKRTGLAIIAEGEKSVLQAEKIFGRENNVVVASCGSAINKWQILTLMKHCNPQEIIVAYDKEESNNGKYFASLQSKCKRYINYTNISFLYDFYDNLKLKDSPFDNEGKSLDILIKTRVRVK